MVRPARGKACPALMVTASPTPPPTKRASGARAAARTPPPPPGPTNAYPNDWGAPSKRSTKAYLDVQEGKLDPAAYSAMCRGAKVMADLYRRADEEMELIRNEETEAAAMEVVGALGNPAILTAAAQISAEHDRYRAESLIEQGLATLEPGINHDSAAPAGLVLTDAGRRRFGLQQLTSYTQEDIDQIEALLERPFIHSLSWTVALKNLYKMHTAMEKAIADLARDPAPLRDALTGHTLSALPAGVKTGPVPAANPGKTESAIKLLKDQLRQVERLTRAFEIRFEKELIDERLNRISEKQT